MYVRSPTPSHSCIRENPRVQTSRESVCGIISHAVRLTLTVTIGRKRRLGEGTPPLWWWMVHALSLVLGPSPSNGHQFPPTPPACAVPYLYRYLGAVQSCSHAS